MLVTRVFALLFLLLLLSSCEKSTEDLTGLDTIELRKKWRECAYIHVPSSREKQTCDNYEKECKDRQNKGNLACY